MDLRRTTTLRNAVFPRGRSLNHAPPASAPVDPGPPTPPPSCLSTIPSDSLPVSPAPHPPLAPVVRRRARDPHTPRCGGATWSISSSSTGRSRPATRRGWRGVRIPTGPPSPTTVRAFGEPPLRTALEALGEATLAETDVPPLLRRAFHDLRGGAFFALRLYGVLLADEEPSEELVQPAVFWRETRPSWFEAWSRPSTPRATGRTGRSEPTGCGSSWTSGAVSTFLPGTRGRDRGRNRARRGRGHHPVEGRARGPLPRSGRPGPGDLQPREQRGPVHHRWPSPAPGGSREPRHGSHRGAQCPGVGRRRLDRLRDGRGDGGALPWRIHAGRNGAGASVRRGRRRPGLGSGDAGGGGGHRRRRGPCRDGVFTSWFFWPAYLVDERGLPPTLEAS
jgi:hypothetical protein